MNTEPIETQAVVVREHNEVAQPLSLSEIEQRLDFIKQVMAKRMAEGVDYGKIPGCGDKPGLFQPGAQKLALTFQLAPLVHREVLRELRNDHREYEFTLEIKSAAGRVLGHGVGSCSTLEAKYRYRSGGRKCPECGKEAIFKSKNPGEGFYCWAKKDGCGAKFAANDARIIGQDTGRIEHDNPADFYNTVRKMAFKRALVHGMINATNTSELWSQDLEDLPQAEEAPISRPVPRPPSEPHQPVKVAQKPTGGTQAGQNTAMIGALKQRIEKLKVSLGPKLDYATAYLKVFTVSGSDQGTSLMPNEDVSDLSETSVDWLAHNWGDFIKRLDAYIEDQGGLGPVAGTPAAPAEDPDWFWDVIVVVPRRGMKKAEYQKNPDTIRSLYDAMKAGDEDAQARLWGLAEQWTPEPWTSPKGQVYQPSEADLKCRKALDAYLEHEKKAKL